MKITIDNRTDYRTSDIRKLVRLALKEADVAHLPRYHVRIRWAGRAGQIGGCASLSRCVFQLGLPRRASSDSPELRELPPPLVRQMAKVAVHEIHHTKGEKHGDMPSMVNNWWEMTLPWAEGLRVRREEPVAKPDRETKARAAVERLESLIEAEERRHVRALKNLRTRLRKARTSVRYYDRKAAKTPREGEA